MTVIALDRLNLQSHGSILLPADCRSVDLKMGAGILRVVIGTNPAAGTDVTPLPGGNGATLTLNNVTEEGYYSDGAGPLGQYAVNAVRIRPGNTGKEAFVVHYTFYA